VRFAAGADARSCHDGVRANAVHTGAVAETSLSRHVDPELDPPRRSNTALLELVTAWVSTPWRHALESIRGAVCPDSAGFGPSLTGMLRAKLTGRNAGTVDLHRNESPQAWAT
jgi:hypothetical protein